MDNDSASITSIRNKGSLGNRIRTIADQLRQESNLQIKVTSQILSAAAKISENHDRLIDEVVEIVEEDLQSQEQLPEPYTVEKLKRQFRTLNNARNHFDIKANSWASLVSKLNGQTVTSQPVVDPFKERIAQRLDAIELEVRAIRVETNTCLKLLTLISDKLGLD